MVRLNEDEIKWLESYYPQMAYDEKKSVITGLFPISHTYNGIVIKDHFNIQIRLDAMLNREEYPKIYNIDSRIQKIANRKRMKIIDLHIDEDNCLCLGLPERFHEYYPNGFQLQTCCKHLSEHLYWVAYYERYDKEPWRAELHGCVARIEFLCENIDELLKNNEKLEKLRQCYKKEMGHGISKSKLLKQLNEPSLFIKKIMQV